MSGARVQGCRIAGMQALGSWRWALGVGRWALGFGRRVSGFGLGVSGLRCRASVFWFLAGCQAWLQV